MNIFARSRDQLVKRLVSFGIEAQEARQEAKLIVEAVTGLTASEQITSNLCEFESAWQAEIELIAQKRERGVPIQYILGKAAFMGLDLQIGPGVLIPRQDTETLVQVVLDLAKLRGVPEAIGEIGVGAGPIAISVLKALRQSRLFACDISKEALVVTLANARNYGVSDRLELIEGDWRAVLPRQLDAVVSNPPYVSWRDKRKLPREILEHEPAAALFDADGDGLGFFRAFASDMALYLKEGSGWLAVEFGDGQEQAIAEVFLKSAWRQVTVYPDVNGLPRVLSAVVPETTNC